MADRRQPVAGLCFRAVSAAWGWRLEAVTTLAAALVLRLVDTLGPGGPVLLAGGVALVFWRSPRLRRLVPDRLRRASQHRWFARALRSCGQLGPFGQQPAIRAVHRVPAGVHLVVRVPRGHHTGHLASSAEALAASLRVREVRVLRDPADASIAHVTVIQRDPFGGPPLAWPWVAAGRTTLWWPVPLGVAEDGSPAGLTLPEHNLLLGGEPGAGKSAALSLIVAAAALDPTATITLLDGKQVELAAWTGCAERFVGPDMAEAADLLDDLRADMDRRYAQLLATGRRKIDPGCGFGLHLVVVDELAFYVRGGKTEVRNRLTESLRDLVSRGRAAGVVVVAATQKPSHDVVPTWIRDLFSFRLALRCTTPEASDTILGQGWASQGFTAATIAPAQRGVGYLLAEGGIPVKLRCAYLDDQAVADIAARAEALRRQP